MTRSTPDRALAVPDPAVRRVSPDDVLDPPKRVGIIGGRSSGKTAALMAMALAMLQEGKSIGVVRRDGTFRRIDP